MSSIWGTAWEHNIIHLFQDYRGVFDGGLLFSVVNKMFKFHFCDGHQANTHSLLPLTFFSTGLSTTSLISATGRRWWRATPTSRSMTTSGTMWWCPGMPTTYTPSRSTHAPLLSTPMEPATWTSKVMATVRKKYPSVGLPLCPLQYGFKVALNTCQLKSI